MNTKEKKEKKGAGVPLTAGSGNGVATQALSRATQITVRGVVHRSLAGSVLHFFSSGAGMLTLTALVAGTSFFSMWDLNRQKQEALAKRHVAATFGQNAPAQAAVQQSAASPQTDSLGYLAAANQAANGGSAGSPSTAQAPADASAQPALSPAGAVQPVNNAIADQNNAHADAAGQAQAAVQGGLGSRFGQLSSGVGGGNHLAGGSGLSGGIGREFDPKTLLAQLPNAAHGASGSGNGAAASAAGVSRTAIQGGGGGKGALGQARVAAAMGMTAKASGNGESSAFQAGQAFDANNGGAGAGGGQQLLGAGDSSSGPGSSAAGLTPGGPTPQTPSGGGGAANMGSSNNNVPGTDVTPWGELVQVATLLLTLAGVFLLAANIPWTPFTSYKTVMAGIATALALAVTAIGVMIMTMYGQTIQGGVFTLVGGILAVIAGTEAFGIWGGPPAPAAGATTGAAAGAPATQALSASQVNTAINSAFED